MTQRVLKIGESGHSRVHTGRTSSKDGAVIIPPAEFAVDAAVSFNLRNCAVVVFADALSAERFLNILEDEGNLEELLEKVICSIGTVAVERLRRRAVHTDVSPIKPRADDALDALLEYGADISEMLVVGGHADQRAAISRRLTVLEVAPKFWPDGETAWVIPSVNGRESALVLGGGVDVAHVRDWSDVVTLGATFGMEALIEAGVAFDTADLETRQGLVEFGARLMR